MTVAFYISAHGFGHAVRCSQIIAALPPQIPVLIRSMTPPWFFEQEIHARQFQVEPAGFDYGAMGPDAVGIDPVSSLMGARDFHDRAMATLDEEVAFLREQRVQAVVSDVPPPPLLVARDLGLPSLLVANFTWVEIYEGWMGGPDEAELEAKGTAVNGPMVRGASAATQVFNLPPAVTAGGRQLVESMRRAYAAAGAHLIPGLAVEMTSVERRARVPIIARQGVNVRKELARALEFDPDRPIIQVYLGTAGLEAMDWERLAEYSEIQFFSFTPVPGEFSGRIRVLEDEELRHADATASVDAVVGKLGYSLCAECLASGIPILYAPRKNFAEFPALEAGMREAGLGVRLTDEAFRNLEWREALERASEARATVEENEGANLPDTDGAGVCATLLAEAWRTGNLEHLG